MIAAQLRSTAEAEARSAGARPSIEVESAIITCTDCGSAACTDAFTVIKSVHPRYRWLALSALSGVTEISGVQLSVAL